LKVRTTTKWILDFEIDKEKHKRNKDSDVNNLAQNPMIHNKNYGQAIIGKLMRSTNGPLKLRFISRASMFVTCLLNCIPRYKMFLVIEKISKENGGNEFP